MPKTVTGDAIKISELGIPNKVGENDVVPINSVTSSGATFTAKSTVNELRQTLEFDNAFTSVASALLAVKEKDIFFVYEDSTKNWVLEYQKLNGVSLPVLGYDNKQIRLPTQRLKTALGSVIEPGGAEVITMSSIPLNLDRFGESMAGLRSINKLRSFEPTFPGQIVQLVSSNESWVTATTAKPNGLGIFYFG